MKTKLISTLKKELLIIEAKNESIAWAMVFNKWGSKEVLKWTILGKPDEIKEDDVVGLCDRIGINNPLVDCDFFVHYGNDETMFETALGSFNSALESEIYWNVNPSLFYDNENDPEIRREMRYRWELAEEKTFDRNRSIILVKN